jgi:ankyrin repeat protein|eukprot:g6683.t1
MASIAQKASLAIPFFNGLGNLACAQKVFSQIFFWVKINSFLVGEDFKAEFNTLVQNLNDDVFFPGVRGLLARLETAPGFFFHVQDELNYIECARAYLLIDKIKQRVKRIPDPDGVLVRAASTGRADNVYVLLRIGLDAYTTDRFGKHILQTASFHGHQEVVKELVSYMNDPGYLNSVDAGGMTALMHASVNNKPRVARFLLNNGANWSTAENIFGKQALHLAAEAGHIKIVKLLSEFKADLNAYSKEGYTALIYAAKHSKVTAVKQRKVCEYLLGQKETTDPALRSRKHGQCALHFASWRNNLPVVTLLAGCLPPDEGLNCQDDYGYTPLMWAARSNNHGVVQYLVDQGANLSLVDKKLSATALELARKKNFPRCISILEKAHGISEEDKLCEAMEKQTAVADHWEPADFFAASSFVGAKAGFVFQMGAKGLGYYTNRYGEGVQSKFNSEQR